MPSAKYKLPVWSREGKANYSSYMGCQVDTRGTTTQKFQGNFLRTKSFWAKRIKKLLMKNQKNARSPLMMCPNNEYAMFKIQKACVIPKEIQTLRILFARGISPASPLQGSCMNQVIHTDFSFAGQNRNFFYHRRKNFLGSCSATRVFGPLVNPIRIGLSEHHNPGIRVPILFGNDLLWNH